SVWQVEDTAGRAVGRKSAAEGSGVAVAGKAQQRVAVAVAEAVLHGSSIFEPDLGKPHPRIGARHIVDEIVLWPFAGLGGNQPRPHIAVAELGAHHLIGLALFDVGDTDEVGAGLGAFRRVVADRGTPHGAPFAPPRRGKARRRNVAFADLAAL